MLRMAGKADVTRLQTKALRCVERMHTGGGGSGESEVKEVCELLIVLWWWWWLQPPVCTHIDIL